MNLTDRPPDGFIVVSESNGRVQVLARGTAFAPLTATEAFDIASAIGEKRRPKVFAEWRVGS